MNCPICKKNTPVILTTVWGCMCRECKAEKQGRALPSPGIALIAGERRRQFEREKYFNAHDDKWVNGELARAAACYSVVNILGIQAYPPLDLFRREDKMWWKPSEDPVRNLIKAGALIAAEIDRLLRKQEQERASKL